jgi:hypothetical protein
MRDIILRGDCPMEQVTEELKRVIRAKGDPCEVDSLQCELWLKDHRDCMGCPSCLGCAKLSRILGIFLSTVIYSPKDFQDFRDQMNHIMKLADKALSAKTLEELDQVPFL